MANLLTNLFRRRPAEVTRYTLSQYLQQRVDAFESMVFPGFDSAVSIGGRTVEQVENSYTGYVGGAYKTDSVVAACMRVRRDIFRQARFCWRELNDNGPGRVFRDDALSLLENPWPNGTTGELLTRMITDVDLCGNAYVVNEGDRLRWLRPDWVSIILSGDPAEELVDVKGYIYAPGGVDLEHGTVYLPDEICHWSPLPDPTAQYRGMSWLTPAIREIQADKAATEHKLMFFANGATLGPIFRLPKEVTLEQFKDFVTAADAAHVGAQNAYRPVYVGGGADVTLSSATLQQIEFKATQGAGETRIAALAGVHPVLVGLSEGLSGSSLNAGNFNSARRSTADIALWPLWQDVCAALSAFVSVPDGVELWIRDKEIPFLREDAKDRAEITKERMLGIEAGIRAGFKPDALVEAFVTDDITSLHGQHSNLFSVQLQPAGSNGQPLDTTAEPPVNFGALRARAFVRRLAIEAGDDDDLEDELDELERRYDERVPKGFHGGGRFRKLSDRLIALLKDWAKGEGPDDPLDEFSRDQLRRMAKEFADKARADGDDERAVRLTPRRGASSEEIKLALYKDVRAEVRGERDEKAEAGPKTAKFTLQGLGKPEKVREVEVENKIRAAYLKILGGKQGLSEWVGFADLREAVDDVPRAELDSVLKKMLRAADYNDAGRVRMIPVANTKALKPRDWAAAMPYGDDRLDAISFGDASPRPLPKSRRDLDVAVYRDAAGKPALFEENDRGERGSLVQRFDSLEDLEAWATDNGEPRLAQWAAKERGGKAPEKATPKPAAKATPAKKAAPAPKEVAPTAPAKAAPTKSEVGIHPHRWGRGLYSVNVGDRRIAQSFTKAQAEKLKAAIDAADDPEAVIEAAYRAYKDDAAARLAWEHEIYELAKVKGIPTGRGESFDDVVAALKRKKVALPEKPTPTAASKIPGAPRNAAPKAAPAEVATIASGLHEDWRKTRLNADGSYEPRVKTTKDKAWIDAHGTDQVDIANTTYADLPEDWQAENRAAAKVIAGILRRRGGVVDLDDPATRQDVGEEIHKAWLSRNAWAAGGDLDVPFADLPASEQAKDLDQVRVALDVVGVSRPVPAKKATPAKRTPGKAVPKADLPDLTGEDLRDALDLRTVPQLKDLLRERGLPFTSRDRKRALVDRLVEAVGTGTPTKKVSPRKAADLAVADWVVDNTPSYGTAEYHGVKPPTRPSGLPTGRKLESGDFDDLAERITGKSEAQILGILRDLNATELARLARKFSGSRGGGGLGGEQNKPRGIAIPAGLSLEERRRWLAKQLSDQRFAWRSMDLDDYEDDELDEDFTEVVRSEPDEEDEEAIRVAGGDTFREYWTRSKEGLAKWVGHPHPWTALRNHLRKHVGQARANRIASQWFKLVFGIWPGERKGDNPVGPG